MRIGGVGLEITPAAQAALAEEKPRVLLFNHSSTVDTFVGAAVLPVGGVLVLKREFLFYPFMGVAAWAVGNIFIDRRDGEKARASLKATMGPDPPRQSAAAARARGDAVKGAGDGPVQARRLQLRQ